MSWGGGHLAASFLLPPQSQLQPEPGSSVVTLPLEVISMETNVICWETGNSNAEGVSWEQISAIP